METSPETAAENTERDSREAAEPQATTKPPPPTEEVLKEVRVSLERMIQQLAALVSRLETLA